jgi:flavin-dependent dehydrogenase
MYDAIIIGARVAGAPTAMLLARKGYKVLAVDRATFPSDTLSTHFMQPDGTERLKRWGVLDAVLANGAPLVSSLRMTVKGTKMPSPLAAAPIPAICPRRGPYDFTMIEAAREAGAEVREGFHISALTRDETGRVTGLTGKGADGVEVTEEAKIVIGADGRTSYLANEVDSEEYDVRPLNTCGGYVYMEGVPNDGADLHLREKTMFFLFPTDDGQVCVGTEWQQERHDEFRADPLAGIMKTLEMEPELFARVKQGTPIENVRGLLMEKSFFRKPFGPGWALVGDAGYTKDPITGLGMGDALRDTEFLVQALDAGFSGAQPMEEALAQYQEKRDNDSKMMYEVTHQLATLDPPDAFVEMMVGAVGQA